MSIVELTYDKLDDTLKNTNKKVLVDCYANWCGPCRMLSPIIDEISEERQDYDFYKIDIDNNEEICNRYEIMSIPTLLIFENNELQEKIIGLKSKDELNDILNK